MFEVAGGILLAVFILFVLAAVGAAASERQRVYPPYVSPHRVDLDMLRAVAERDRKWPGPYVSTEPPRRTY